MYREMGNGGAWGGTDINYVVIILPSHTKKKIAINIILLSLLSLILLLPNDRTVSAVLLLTTCRSRLFRSIYAHCDERRFRYFSIKRAGRGLKPAIDQL